MFYLRVKHLPFTSHISRQGGLNLLTRIQSALALIDMMGQSPIFRLAIHVMLQLAEIVGIEYRIDLVALIDSLNVTFLPKVHLGFSFSFVYPSLSVFQRLIRWPAPKAIIRSPATQCHLPRWLPPPSVKASKIIPVTVSNANSRVRIIFGLLFFLRVLARDLNHGQCPFMWKIPNETNRAPEIT